MRYFRVPPTCPSLPALTLSSSCRFLLLLALGTAALTSGSPAAAQPRSRATEPSPASSLCGRDSALEIIRQQVDATKTFDDPVQRIAVLVRAADLLWPYQQQKARATFTEAFDLATQDFKEKGDEPKRRGVGLLVETPDQRYVVTRAIARRDPAWAKRLSEAMLKEEGRGAEAGAAKDPRVEVRTAEKLLDSAISFLPSDMSVAISFASASLRYPASLRLTTFLYKLAEVDKRGADEFYERALAVYGDKPMREFLYLAAYPFGLRDAGDMPWMGPYAVPAAFAPSVSLQRTFVQALLRRARQALETPLDEGDNYNGFPGTGHILQVLTRIEPQVRKRLPDLIGEMEQARSSLFNSLPQEAQAVFLRPDSQPDSAPRKTFDEQLEAAEKEANASRRDELIATAILNAGPAESLDRVVGAADKIADANVRLQLLDWLHFIGAQRAVRDQRLDEAAKLAARVRELDQRAYLYSEIAKESLQKTESQSQARELLDEIVATATKAPNTVVAARALLSAAHLYLKIDPSQSMAILGDAVRRINGIESPDFSGKSVVRKIEGKNFARYAAFKSPGFDPENAFREMAKIAFDNTLFHASSLTDKHLRAMTTLALADFCLQRAERQKTAGGRKGELNP